MSKVSVKPSFEAAKTIRPIYTGGSVSLDRSGRFLATCLGEDASIINLETGDQLAYIEGDGEVLTSLALSPTVSHLVLCSRSLSMRIFYLSRSDEGFTPIRSELLRTIKPHTSPVVTTSIDVTGSLLATGGADGSVKVWDLKRGYATHNFHGHRGVISALCFFEVSGTRIGDDGGGKFGARREKKSGDRGSAKSDVEASTREGLRDLSTSGFRLASGGEDGRIRVWDLDKKTSVATLESHVSVVRSLSFSSSTNTFLSASRDKTIILWDVQTWTTTRIIPVLESVEAAGFLFDGSLCYSGGENGRLRIWNAARGQEATMEQDAAAEQESIVAIEYSPGCTFILSVHADQTLRFHSVDSLNGLVTGGTVVDPLPIIRRVSGNDDEVIDLVCVGRDRSLLALASNSEYVRVVAAGPMEQHANQTGHSQLYFGADVVHLDGHEDVIICLDVDWSGHWLATGAKDNTARLWRIDPEASSYTCVATFTGHAQSLGGISFSRLEPAVGSAAYIDPLNHPPSFLFTGSQDRTIKRWDIAKLIASNASTFQSPNAAYTRKAHDKDINALDVDSSSTLLASASQDRTAKIWSVLDGSVLGILRGHKRGVWSVRFPPKNLPTLSSDSGKGPSRSIVATGSGDKTIKLWSLSDYSCVLTFEGHTNSVLKVVWLSPPRVSAENQDISSRGATQTNPLVASAGADGLIKVWSPYTGEVETTLDNHTDRVWALATPFPPTSISDSKSVKNIHEFALISGAADSTVTFWADTTSATLSAEVTAQAVRVEQDQQLQNYIHAGSYREAITLALQLNHPARLLSLFTAALDAESEGHDSKLPNLSCSPAIDDVLRSLDPDNLYLLLLRLRDWNTNAKTSRVAQRILYTLSKFYPPSTFVELASSRRGVQPSNAAPGRSKPQPTPEVKDVFDALIAYTERHYKRVEDLIDESSLVEWVLGEMDGGLSGVSASKLQNGTDISQTEDVIMLGV